MCREVKESYRSSSTATITGRGGVHGGVLGGMLVLEGGGLVVLEGGSQSIYCCNNTTKAFIPNIRHKQSIKGSQYLIIDGGGLLGMMESRDQNCQCLEMVHADIELVLEYIFWRAHLTYS